jgi:outer membrane protein assembly factor BamE (lipoprotein component of BamABCDE complex)
MHRRPPADQDPIARSAARAIRWSFVLAAVVAFVLVISSFKKADDQTSRVKTLLKPARVTPRQFRQVVNGMSVERVRRLLGAPDEQARAGGQLCWDYGTPLSKGGMYAVCFRRGRVTYTSRIG